jgi:hypothetical protein
VVIETEGEPVHGFVGAADALGDEVRALDESGNGDVAEGAGRAVAGEHVDLEAALLGSLLNEAEGLRGESAEEVDVVFRVGQLVDRGEGQDHFDERDEEHGLVVVETVDVAETDIFESLAEGVRCHDEEGQAERLGALDGFDLVAVEGGTPLGARVVVIELFVAEIIGVRAAGVFQSQSDAAWPADGPAAAAVKEDAGLAGVEAEGADCGRFEAGSGAGLGELAPQGQASLMLALSPPGDPHEEDHDSRMRDPAHHSRPQLVGQAEGAPSTPRDPLCLSGCLGRGNTKKSVLRKRILGLWRSLVAHLTGGQGVAGSNPVSPTES